VAGAVTTASEALPAAVLEGSRARIDLAWQDASHARGTITRIRDGQAAGRVTLEALGDGVLFIVALEVELPYRGYGLGSESARLLRGWAEAGGWRVLRAWAPPDLGLAVYFWSRMGLRPLHGPGPDGGSWFERLLRG
jgi:GNAT superfamily N-acetyltransferase